MWKIRVVLFQSRFSLESRQIESGYTAPGAICGRPGKRWSFSFVVVVWDTQLLGTCRQTFVICHRANLPRLLLLGFFFRLPETGPPISWFFRFREMRTKGMGHEFTKHAEHSLVTVLPNVGVQREDN